MMTLTIEIPALDRLCTWLEGRDKTGLLEAIENEITNKLKEAAGNGTLEKAANAPADKPTSAEPQKAPQEPPKPPKPEVTEKPTAAAEPAPATPAVTLDAVQRAAAQMRDDGKLKAVTDMFPEFGIVRLSDLKADQLPVFAERLRGMGAEL